MTIKKAAEEFIMDSTIIAAPSPTKNRDKQRDPGAHQVKKGNAWRFGYKAHVGMDQDSGLVHTLKVISANVHDVSVASELLTEREESVYATAAVSALKSEGTPSYATSRAGKSNTGSTAVHVQPRMPI